jgi:hypothetical protein
MNATDRKRLLELAYQRGLDAVRMQPRWAPSNPYDEDESLEEFEQWEDGAYDAGILDLYANSELISARRERN